MIVGVDVRCGRAVENVLKRKLRGGEGEEEKEDEDEEKGGSRGVAGGGGL